jgi:hypothetical protein
LPNSAISMPPLSYFSVFYVYVLAMSIPLHW